MEYQQRLKELKDRYQLLKKNFKREEKQKELQKLEADNLKGSFWKRPENAREIMKRISSLKEEITVFDKLEKELIDLDGLISLASGDQKIAQELISEFAKTEKEIENLEEKMFLSGPYDASYAILSIHAGQGGVEAMDWVDMLSRMYQKYFSSKKWQYVLIDEVPGEEAGFKTVSISVQEDYAYGLLKGESGVHRLVRQSPFNAASLRQTSFALVEVMPEIDQSGEVEIKPEEIKFEAYRAGGHGGQNVNKVSTAIRLKHIPSGIVVTCQTQRYQAQNRGNALRLLKAKLWMLKQKEQRETKEKIRGAHVTPGWGNQIRSYVLHPYKMVKDLRTNYETSNAQKVLDGDLEEFIKRELAMSFP